MKLTTTKGLLVALSALAFGLSAGGCSLNGSDKPGFEATDENSGSLGLNLTIGNTELKEVKAVISSTALAADIVKTIPVGGKKSTISILLGGLPAGSYTIALSGKTIDGKIDCSGSASFSITAGSSTGVTVPLACTSDAGRGSVTANGTLNRCPQLTGFLVAPLATDVGESILAESSVTDADAGDEITYAWTATQGTFANPAAANTTYKCTSSGDQTLTLTAKDKGNCVVSSTVSVSCVATAVCGDGNAEADKGEECDPPAPGVCRDNCTKWAQVCGDGAVTAPETCDPPGSATCNSQCQTISCGDGRVDTPAEQCEPPNSPRGAGNCDAACKTIPSVCGNSIKEPGEECDGTAGCLPTCKVDGDVCGTCTSSNCAGVLPDFTVRCTGTTCDALEACMDTSNCAANDVRDCYCGSTAYSSCFLFDAAAPKGACKDIINTMAGSTTPLQVGTVFFDGTTALGALNNVKVCQASSCKSACFN
jgi:hypothetical protein